MAAARVETFGWEAAARILRRWPRLAWVPERGHFTGLDDGCPITLRLPLILPVPAGTRTAADAELDLDPVPGRHLLVLIQAGAVALGWFEAGEAVRTKSDKKYVVRGRGRAQPTHLASKGKSRYGSRLRLQNARALLSETNERMIDWVETFGTPDRVFYNCPVRLWSDLLLAKPEPPFRPGGPDEVPTVRIPLDLPVPTTEVLLRTYKTLSYGRIEWQAPEVEPE